jgi:hypothetical protein
VPVCACELHAECACSTQQTQRLYAARRGAKTRKQPAARRQRRTARRRPYYSVHLKMSSSFRCAHPAVVGFIHVQPKPLLLLLFVVCVQKLEHCSGR